MCVCVCVCVCVCDCVCVSINKANSTGHSVTYYIQDKFVFVFQQNSTYHKNVKIYSNFVPFTFSIPHMHC